MPSFVYNINQCSSVTGAADDGNYNPNYGVSALHKDVPMYRIMRVA